jgi:putative flippase GtrA
MGTLRLTVLYTLFGGVATVANLAAQGLTNLIVPTEPGAVGFAYWLALGVGTGAGLVVKYVLDKRWIFFDRSTGIAAHGQRFALYSLMGIATTVIFWAIQTASFAYFGTRTMLYVGGAVGLAIGYVVKYQLDRRFVFNRPEASL